MPSKRDADADLNPVEATVIKPLQQFAKSSYYFIKKCEKPDRKQLTQLVLSTGAGFLIMGFVGFFVKLIHIPINNIIVG